MNPFATGQGAEMVGHRLSLIFVSNTFYNRICTFGAYKGSKTRKKHFV
jgi:hypothetical protein